MTVISGVVVGDSPNWIARRLSNSGMRPINNVVDASNLVMLELNQPTHAFDADKVNDGFRIRCARQGETLLTLDGQNRELESNDLLICDGKDNAIGLAGVMGGASTEIDANTKTVALETAWFESAGVARTAARLGLKSEASMRFERGVDPYGIDLAVSRFAALLRESCPDLVVHSAATDVKEKTLPPKQKNRRVAKCAGRAHFGCETLDESNFDNACQDWLHHQIDFVIKGVELGSSQNSRTVLAP